MQRGFTLIELLVVIAVVAVLSVAVVVTLNPTELLKQARDSTRISDLVAINKALGIMQAQSGTVAFGDTDTAYISIPDSDAGCANLGLGSGYTCAAAAAVQGTAGSGWIPVNFSLLGSETPLSVLPLDPVNSTTSGTYYLYQVGANGMWKLSATLESVKFAAQAANDGGTNAGRIERGTDLAIEDPGDATVPGNPILWLAADHITGYTDGQEMTSWADSGTFGNNATAMTALTLEPTYETNRINGLPSVNFASGGYFQLGNLMNGLTGAEVFHVLRIPTEGVTNGFTTFGTGTQLNTYSYFGSIYDDFGSTLRYNAGNPPGVLTDWRIYNVSASSSWEARIDGSVLATQPTNTFAYRTNPRIGYSMGGGLPWDGELAELVLYSAPLSSSERQDVLDYLQAKYAL